MIFSRPWFTRGYSHLMLAMRNSVVPNVGPDYVCRDGFPLGNWVAEVRTAWNKGDLTDEQIKSLQHIGLAKDEEMQQWTSIFVLAEDYVRSNACLPDRDYRTVDGILLGAWLERQRLFFPSLCEEQQEKLRKLGI